ncbi:sugar transporter ERD6-like 5 [Solanum tuberosum]|uniref:sugar transporter ERD6-like 5 n=1 Tax=Solanum tuberosum TaxID=4113 RepID=UPI00073A2B1C|nr:PREDICTED: sugar transporter ERD6-like 5 [Solanum tuberosum]
MDLFSRKYARLLIIGIGLMALVQLGGNNAITSFASSIFRAAGCSADSASQVMVVLQLPFAVASIILTEKAGRRLLMLAPCTHKIVRRTFLLCNSNAVSSGTAVLPASSSVRPSSKPSSIQRSDAIVPKITAIPLPATCTMTFLHLTQIS